MREDQAYTPELVEANVRHWQELRSAAEGGTGTLNGSGAGKGDRLGIAVVMADLERAADALPVRWLATAYVYALQEREEAWRQRVAAAGGPHLLVEADVPLERAFEHMARSLGWQQPTPTSI